MNSRSTPMRDAHGDIVGLAVGMTVVDDLVRARQAAEATEERLRRIIDGMLDPQILLKPVRDLAGRIIDFTYIEANLATCEYLHLRRQDLVGRRLVADFGGSIDSGLPARYVHAFESGEPIVLNDYTHDSVVLRTTRRYDVRGTRAGDDLSITWRDVTERAQAADRLARSEQRFRPLAEHATDVVVHSRGGVLEWVSPSLREALGWQPEQWVGHPITDFMHPDDGPLIARVRDAVHGGRRMTARSRFRDSSGAYVWMESFITGYLGEDGQDDGVVASIRPAAAPSPAPSAATSVGDSQTTSDGSVG